MSALGEGGGDGGQGEYGYVFEQALFSYGIRGRVLRLGVSEC